jgi:hypothetical protein
VSIAIPLQCSAKDREISQGFRISKRDIVFTF